MKEESLLEGWVNNAHETVLGPCWEVGARIGVPMHRDPIQVLYILSKGLVALDNRIGHHGTAPCSASSCPNGGAHFTEGTRNRHDLSRYLGMAQA